MIVCKKFTFEAAHQIKTLNDPKENRLHGHSYQLFVCVQGAIDKNGVVMDFTDVKEIVNRVVLSKLDHMFLNDAIEVPTVENISLWIWQELHTCIPLYEVKLWETQSNYAVYRGE